MEFREGGLRPDIVLSQMTLSMTSNSMDCRVAWGRYASAENECISFRNHKHHLYELHMVRHGELSFLFSDGQEVRIGREQYILIPPDIMHTVVNRQKSTLKLVIAFDGTALDSTSSLPLQSAQPLKVLDASAALKRLADAFLAKKQIPVLPRSFSTLCVVYSIILEALENASLSEDGKPGVDSRYKTDIGTDDRMRLLTDYIKDNAFQRITGEQIASLLGITVRQLNRLSNAHFGCAINEIIIRERIRQIKLLLEDVNWSLTDISEIAGFSSVYSFIRHFKHFTGVTPGEYRKQS